MTTERIFIESRPGNLPIDNPTVAHYTANTVLWLGARARDVFRELGRYVDPNDGNCYPSQDTIASALDICRQSVGRLCDKLVAAGELAIEHKERASGKQNLYTFTGGLRKGWVPDDKLDLDGRSIEQYYFEQNIRLRAQVAELQQAFNRVLSTGEIPRTEGGTPII